MGIEQDGRKEVVPLCPTHASSKVRFGQFGDGLIVTCHQERNHLVSLCEREQFEAERQEARGTLYPGEKALGGQQQ